MKVRHQFLLLLSLALLASMPALFAGCGGKKDSTRGWAVGSRDILYTSNGGKIWTRQKRLTWDAYSCGISFSDASHGWIVGDDAYFTSDGGTSWQKYAKTGRSASLSGFSDIDFADLEHGWAVGPKGAVVATTDGGHLWKAQSSGTVDDLTGVTFADDLHGWAVGNNGVIVATSDGGAHWTRQRSPTSDSLSDVTFVDASHGWVTGAGIFATTNGGKTWREQYGLSGWSVSFADLSHGWFIGGGGVLATSNGGRNWGAYAKAPRSKVGYTGYIEVRRVVAVNARHAWVVGDLGTILATGDGGKTWVKQESGTTDELYCVASVAT